MLDFVANYGMVGTWSEASRPTPNNINIFANILGIGIIWHWLFLSITLGYCK